MRAEVTFEEFRINILEKEIQAIPLLNNILVRIISGLNRKEILESRKQYAIKLFNIPKEANEVLLFRQIRNTGAKTVHIFKNSNGNNKGFVVVMFRSKRDLEQAKRYSTKYYDTRLFWEEEEKSVNKWRFNRVEQKQLNLEQDQRNKRYEYIDMSENEVVFNSFEEKQNYKRNKRVQKGKREESSKREEQKVVENAKVTKS